MKYFQVPIYRWKVDKMMREMHGDGDAEGLDLPLRAKHGLNSDGKYHVL
jgi:hypothetical protein